MKRIILLLCIIFSLSTYSSDFKRVVTLTGIVVQDETLEPIEKADIEVWLDDSLILELETDEMGSFKIELSKVDTFDIVVKSTGFHTQIHEGLIIESLRMPSSLDIYMLPIKEEPKDIHCGERCWCVNYEKHDWEKDTLATLKGVVRDKETNEALPFVHVIIKVNGLIVRQTMSDFDGNFKLDSIPIDSCDFKFTTIGYMGLIITKIDVKKTELWDVELLLEDFSNYSNFRCGYSCYGRYTPPEPTIDLFASEKAINDAQDAKSPSAVYQNSIKEPGITAYPNPIMDVVTITRLPKMNQFKIINHMGKELKTIETDERTTITIDLSYLPRGLFFIKYEEEGKSKLYGLVKE
ncbi:MAG: carboxypeptidase-like regulatory domain-containing protein [Salibacteraceae bacterium]